MMTIEEVGRRGGMSRSAAKVAASRANLEHARAIRSERCRTVRKERAERIKAALERGLPTVTQQGAVILVEKK